MLLSDFGSIFLVWPINQIAFVAWCVQIFWPVLKLLARMGVIKDDRE